MKAFSTAVTFGLAMICLAGCDSTDRADDPLQRFRESHVLPRASNILRFESAQGWDGAVEFCLIEVTRPDALEEFMSRLAGTNWVVGDYLQGLTNTVKIVATKFQIAPDELPDLNRSLMWSTPALVSYGKEGIQQFKNLGGVTIVDSASERVWIFKADF